MKLPSPFIALSILFALGVYEVTAQPRQSIFGFGRNQDQISNALFPGEESPTLAATTVSNQSRSASDQASDGSDSIFRNGEPREVSAASYSIRNGERVERPVAEREKKQRSSFFAKFRDANRSGDPLAAATNGNAPEREGEGQVLDPIPRAVETRGPTDPARPTPETLQSDETDSAEPAFTAAPVEEKKKRSGGLFSIFSRNKKKEKDNAIATPVPVATPSESAEMESEGTRESEAVASADSSSGGIPDTPGYDETPSSSSSEPSSASGGDSDEQTSGASSAAEAEVPEFAGSESSRPKKKKKGFSLPNPIEAIPNPVEVFKSDSKPVDMEGAETIIENGEIVGEEEDIVESNIVSTSDDTEREPPREVDGVKTYKSWDDVEARSVSSADKILNRLERR